MGVNNSEPRARSRISQPHQDTPPKPSLPVKQRSRTRQKSLPTFPAIKLPSIQLDAKLAAQYLRALPFLVVSVALYGILVFIFTSIHPHRVANWMLYQSYLPVLLLFFFATLCLTRFILLNKSRSLGLSTWLTFLLLLKLQEVVLSPSLIITSAAVLVGPSLIWPVFFKK